MGNKTKIVVLRLKEIIYTGIFVLLGILFLVILVIMFLPPKTETNTPEVQSESAAYRPGIYTESLSLGNQTLDIEVTVDENNINSIRLVNLNEELETMYPLIEPSFKDLVNQITTAQSLESITYAEDAKYTSLVLLDAIKSALAKAETSSPEAEDEETDIRETGAEETEASTQKTGDGEADANTRETGAGEADADMTETNVNIEAGGDAEAGEDAEADGNAEAGGDAEADGNFEINEDFNESSLPKA